MRFLFIVLSSMNTQRMQHRDAQNIFLALPRCVIYNILYTPMCSRIEFIAEKQNPLTMLSRRVIPPRNLFHPRGFASLNKQEHVLLLGDKVSLLPLKTILSRSKRFKRVVHKFLVERLAHLLQVQMSILFITGIQKCHPAHLTLRAISRRRKPLCSTMCVLTHTFLLSKDNII